MCNNQWVYIKNIQSIQQPLGSSRKSSTREVIILHKRIGKLWGNDWQVWSRTEWLVIMLISFNNVQTCYSAPTSRSSPRLCELKPFHSSFHIFLYLQAFSNKTKSPWNILKRTFLVFSRKVFKFYSFSCSCLRFSFVFLYCWVDQKDHNLSDALIWNEKEGEKVSRFKVQPFDSAALCMQLYQSFHILFKVFACNILVSPILSFSSYIDAIKPLTT